MMVASVQLHFGNDPEVNFWLRAWNLPLGQETVRCQSNQSALFLNFVKQNSRCFQF